MSEDKQQEAVVAWESDSLEVLCEFPNAIKKELGEDIQRMQLGANLVNGKLNRMSVDRLTKYLHRLGRTVEVTMKKGRKLQGAEAA